MFICSTNESLSTHLSSSLPMCLVCCWNKILSLCFSVLEFLLVLSKIALFHLTLLSLTLSLLFFCACALTMFFTYIIYFFSCVFPYIISKVPWEQEFLFVLFTGMYCQRLEQCMGHSRSSEIFVEWIYGL